MPYTLSSPTIKGKKKYCMTNKETGKRYCYDSPEARSNGMQMHEAYAGGWKPNRKKKKSK